MWHDEAGKPVSVIGNQEAHEAGFKRVDHPWGIRLVVKNSIRSGPVFKKESPWEGDGISISTILKENGVYRAWGSTSWGDLKNKGDSYFCYFESPDGKDWRRPSCGIIEYDGDRDNNLLGKHGGTVLPAWRGGLVFWRRK